MASLCKDKNGWYSVQFYTGSTKRSKITLGTKNERTAKRTLEKIELLIRAKQFGQALEADSLTWLQKINGTDLESKLKHANLLHGGPLAGSPEAIRMSAPSLGDFLAGYIEMRKGLKPWTIKNMKTAGNLLLVFLVKTGRYQKSHLLKVKHSSTISRARAMLKPPSQEPCVEPLPCLNLPKSLSSF